MAWFGDSFTSLSNLKGQITNFTKEVLSEGIVEEADERSKALKEANEKCSQLQDLLNTKDAEISLLRRQNGELQRAVIEINGKTKESRDTYHNDETEGVFWDPSCIDNRNARHQNHVRQLQDQLAQATVKVRELECELKHIQLVNNASVKDDIPEGHQRTEVLRAKQDMMNRIIQIEEKTREAERNAKRNAFQLDEAALINDFRTVISKLNSHEKFDLVSSALKALQIESETYRKKRKCEKFDSDEKLEKLDDFEYFNTNSEQSKSVDANEELSPNKEQTLQRRIEELQNENKDLLEAMEKLDEENSQSIEKLLSLREEINKHRSLQNAYDQLSADYNEAQKKIIELRNNTIQLRHDACTEASYQTARADNIDKLNKHTQVTFSAQVDNSLSETSVLDKITENVKAILKNNIVNNIETGESIFEAVAKQYVDVKWKLDVLERKVPEITRNLKDTEEVRDGLQLDCEELQSHIDTLVLENQSLKSNLPSIPEASEERVASLETDVEFLKEEIKRLLTENKIIREMNSALKLAEQSKESLTDHSSREDINREKHLSSEENKKLQADVDKSRGQMHKEFLVPLEEVESSKEDMASMEQLKLEYENATQQLKLTVSKIKSLENDITQQQNIIDKLTTENIDLLMKMEHLEMELNEEHHDLQKEYNRLLADSQQQFDKVNHEKSNLLDDILCKIKELEEARIQIDAKQSQLAKLSQDNERIIKENTSLSEQLTAVHDESLDKIELLNTEMTLLQQEHKDVKGEASTYKRILLEMKQGLQYADLKYERLENEYHHFKLRCVGFEIKNRNNERTIMEQVMNIQELEKERQSIMEELNSLRRKCEILEQERKTEASLTHRDNTNNKTKENELVTTENNSNGIENFSDMLKEGKQNLMTGDTKDVAFDYILQQKIESIIDKEKLENDIVKKENEKLVNEITELRNKLEITLENNKESSEMAKQTIEDLSHLIRDKDDKIALLQIEITRAEDAIKQTTNDAAVIKKQRDELEQFSILKQNECLQYQNEIQILNQHINKQTSHFSKAINEETGQVSLDGTNVNEQYSRSLQNTQNCNEIKNEIVEYSGQIIEITALNEKCATLETALLQEQSANRILQNQLTESQSKEANAAKELERLRTHLFEMEASYTEEALIAENLREELETKLSQAEEKVKNSSTAYTSASIRANQQVETLQQQMTLIIQQRDQIQAKLSSAEDNILQQSASLTNLQIVLEQFQQHKERDIVLATEKIRSQLNESCKKQEELAKEISILKQQLSEAKECLQAASRLSEQLEKKDEQVERLNEEVAQLTTLVNSANQRIKETMERDEGKVDKTLVKNLLLGYLSSTESNKSSILRVFATVLDFTETEKDKTGLNSATTQSNWLLRGKNGNASSKNEETSLSTAFVRFLESESKPKPQLPALPISNSSSSKSGYNKQQSSMSSASSSSSSSTQSMLLTSVALPTFPDFVPARNTGSILKEVLKDS